MNVHQQPRMRVIRSTGHARTRTEGIPAPVTRDLRATGLSVQVRGNGITTYNGRF
jgi:hypothetical protein